MKELMERLSKLEHAYKDINFKASNFQIDPDEYQSQVGSIKQNFDSIKESLSRMGGHFT